MTYIKTKITNEIQIDELITVHYFEYMKDFYFKGESHDFWEFMFVDRGSMLVNADQVTIPLEANDIIFHAPNEFHSMRSTGRIPPNIVAISFTSTSPIMKEFIHRTFTLDEREKALITKILEEASSAFASPLYEPSVESITLSEQADFGCLQLIKNHLEELLILIKRNHLDGATSPILKDKKPSHHSRNQQLSTYEQIQEYLDFHICEPLTVMDICDYFSLSRSTLQALYHQHHNCGVIDTFHRLKLNRAKELIRSGRMNTTEIAMFLGYSSLQHFSRMFKKYNGIPPSQYTHSVKHINEQVKKTPPRNRS